MHRQSATHRALTCVFLLAFAFCLPGPLSLIPSVEAASASASKRIIRKLQKQIRTLKAQLAAATATPATPAPFIEMVTVGNPGNVVDPADGDSITGGTQNFGAVPYEFQIGKFEVTLAQYVAFLNAVAATDTHALYNPSLATDPDIAGITRSGSSGSFTYSVIGDGSRPVTFVSWFDAARFCNWLHNGRPSGTQDATTTERGAYTLDEATNGGLTITRNPGAKFWIPSENEWYKGAYHDPRTAANGGPAGDDFYWLHATKSDTAPSSGSPTGAVNRANFNSQVNALTAVGAYTGSGGFYGTFDQGGNVFEWNDAVIGGTSRGLRGGSWVSGESGLRSSFRIFNDPTLESEDLGFRVAGALPPAAAARPAALPKVSTSGPPARVIKALKKQVKTLKAQLAAATAVPPTPAPFVEMVKVGNAGNAADPEDGDNNVGGTQNFGAVPYEYSIGKYEVTLAQYVAFLNAVAATDTHGLYNGSMATDLNSAGITQNGASPSFTYSVIGTGTRPVTLVNWFDAARFCNWLHNGRPKGAQDAGTTETGAYALNGANSGVVITREATAKFWLPNADEWHKAAYHQPASQGGDTDNYWLYPTGSNTIPTVATVNEIGEITNDNENIANYAFGAVWNGQNGNLTSVGSGGAGSASHYGAFDMGGNVEEWTDFAEATFRFVLGGTFISTESAMRASERNRLNPVTHFPDLGFRVAGSVN